MKRMHLLIAILMLTQDCFALKVIYCPTIENIKNKELHGWLPFYRKDETLVSAEDMKKFRESIVSFRSAQWNINYFATGHCNYSGNGSIVNQIVLGQQPWSPVRNDYWHWIKKDTSAECQQSEVTNCGYLP